MPSEKRARGSSRRRKPVSSPEPAASQGHHYPIVGIGASAGGLEAFGRLLKALPADTGMAFVLVQHLDPEHESMLSRLLANATEMPVQEVEEGMGLAPNRVYVIPPNRTMGIRDGVLHLMARGKAGGYHMPIDDFLRSLAENEGARAIGVILSGAASDGTLGLKAIKAEGGITFAQDEKSAKYDGMPRSAIAAGCVDFVLPPEGIGRELARIGHHPYLAESPVAADVEVAPGGNEDLRRIFALLRTTTGIDFTYYKYATIKRRIARRLVLHKLSTLPQYLKYLKENRAELAALYEDILIHVTGFFREPETFQQIRDTVLPALIRERPASDPIRVWVAGCSTGEEVYSLAITLLEYLADRPQPPPIQIFGTDISEPALDKARAAIYSQSTVSDIAPDRLRRFFSRADGGYQITKAVREMCIFARQDLAKDPPFSKLDLLSCRNVLIYMGPVLQKKVMATFHYALKPAGVLILGKSESISGFSELFQPLDRKHKIYSRKATEAHAVFELPTAGHYDVREPEPRKDALAKFDVQKEADRIVAAHYAPAGLIVNDNLHILQFRGNVAPYLSPAPGEASLSLLKMVRPEFAVELRTTVHRARKQQAPARKEGLLLKRNGSLYSVSLEVVPIRGDGADGYFLVLFEESRVAEGDSSKTDIPQKQATKRQHMEATRMARELQTTKEYLQSIIEEQEATNEELKSANEEILSSNEELQSTNEELETAKEELQSTNEELVTVNEQLQNRNLELGQLSDDHANLLSAVSIPIVMLGSDRRIRRFTPLAERLLNLLPTDVGRPIDNIRSNLKIANLEALIAEVLETVRQKEQDVQDVDGRWYSMRVRPYRTIDNKIDGVVMVFVDIDALKVTQKALREQNTFSEAVLESAAALVMVTDMAGRIIAFNHACEIVSGYKAAQLQGKPVWDSQLIPKEEAGGAKDVYEKAKAGHAPLQYENHWICREGDRRLIFWSSVPMRGADGAPDHVVHTGADITEGRRAEAALQEKGAALRESERRLQALASGLLRVQEEERKRIARELHDDLSRRLAALTEELEAIVGRNQGGPGRAKLSGLRRRMSELSDAIRKAAHRLHPASLDRVGLAAALKSYCADAGTKDGMTVRFSSRNLPDKIAPDVSLTLYRVVQEALLNAAKHSGARAASVSISARDGRLALTVRDSGRGFSPERRHGKGLGLMSMSERVRLIGGHFALTTKPGEGTHIEVQVPLRTGKPGGAAKTRN